ncbi:cell wall-binding repeat-containing protein [Ornithinimicrobium sp. F0845]|uniref:cell wall-binding repeat-containing protein n=1 Tax=Ornithinimicrobium sp. F0845 TaxID=2926412 RepID=UPI001FF6C369|nr:cell wall-binding repeat-containing protein [Ornithinimicrobium sp. F0845]MCK0113512.1 cell wall-binding repeat-containing protein [Ornithinimicrobium sp. F0845]
MALTTRARRRGVATLATVALAATIAAGSGSTAPLPASETAPTETNQAVQWTGGLDGQAPCPEGRSRSASLLTESFTAGIPNGDFNNGWYRVHTGIGNSAAARSQVSSGDSEDWMFLDWATAPVGAQTMLAFTSRGNVSSSGYSRADVNSVSLQTAANTSSWDGKVFNITAATDDEGGRLGTWFQHRAQPGKSQWWDVDNVQIYTCRAAAVSRIKGTDRYDTSAAIAAQYPAGQDVVYLASGNGFADALAGAALAAKEDAPVLLVRHESIPSSVAAQLDRLNPGRIVIFGGTGAVSNTVRDAARAYTSGEVTRLAGASRYETSAAIADTYPTGISTLYVASGVSYPDALSGGASAGRNGRPLLLTNSDHLPIATREALERLDGGRIVILGGSGAVSNSVQQDLRAYTTGSVTRIAGANRYETSALIADTFPSNRSRVFVATGLDFPDALSGSALAGREANPVLLTQPSRLPASVGNAIDALNPDSGVVLGGYTSVNSIVLDQLGRRVG